MNAYYNPFQPTLTRAGSRRFGLNVECRRPCSRLEGLVYSYLQIKAEHKTLYPIMPDGTQAIYMSSNGLMIGGMQLEAVDMNILQPGEYFGVWFRPGALRHFFKMQMNEIAGAFIDSNDWGCSDLPEFHEKLYELQGFSKRADLCEQWLLNKYSHLDASKFDCALSLIYQSNGAESVEITAKKSGWSSRQMNRQFLWHIGVSPKVFSQVVRVQQVCKQLFTAPPGLKRMIMDHGYYDQSHMIKDFNKYFCAPPKEFYQRFMSDFYNP